jgi:hypothetical protein
MLQQINSGNWHYIRAFDDPSVLVNTIIEYIRCLSESIFENVI